MVDLTAAPHANGLQPLFCWSGGGRLTISPKSAKALARYTAGRTSMRRDLQAFVLSLGSLLAVTGSVLLLLWTVAN
jgi:hypothetical protein